MKRLRPTLDRHELRDRRIRKWHRLTPDHRSILCELLGYQPALEQGPLLDFPESPRCKVCWPEPTEATR